MKISVVMATYNGAAYLGEQLESIRRQTVQPDEVIICDDCSKDDTAYAAQEFISSNGLEENWKVFTNKNNLGYADNFNYAAGLCRGEYIFFADQDDIWLDTKIEKMLKIMTRLSDCQVLCTDYEPFSNSPDAPKPPDRVLKKMTNDGRTEKIVLEKRSIYLRTLGCCMCVRREYFLKIREYWFDGWAQDDRLWRLSQCTGGCYLLHLNLVKHRLHSANTSTYGKYHTLEKRIKLFTAMQKANEQMQKALKEFGANDKKRRLLDQHIAMMSLRLDQLENRNLRNSIKLLKYVSYYEKMKSMLVEVYIILRENG